MGVSKGSAPQPINGQQVGQQQLGANVNTAIANAWLNNTNQQTPYGTLKYDQTGTKPIADGIVVPQFTATTELTPAGQKLQDTQMGITQGTADLAKSYVDRIGAATAQPFSTAGMPAAPQYDEAARTAARDRIVARQQPIMAQQEEALRTRLANQGLQPGSEAYSNAMRDFTRGQNDYYLGADAQAGNEAGMIFGLQGTARDRAINEALMERSQPINEVSALLGTGTGVQNPSFVQTPTTQVQPTDVTTPMLMEQQQRMQAWQQGQSNNNALLGSIFGLGGAALGGWLGGPLGASIGSRIGGMGAAGTPGSPYYGPVYSGVLSR